MIYTHFKTHFHHLSGVKQPLLKSDSGLHIPESSQVILLRPAAAEAESVLLQFATGQQGFFTIQTNCSDSVSFQCLFYLRKLHHSSGRPFQSLRDFF